jgi:hypothetical protein
MVITQTKNKGKKRHETCNHSPSLLKFLPVFKMKNNQAGDVPGYPVGL